MNILMVNTDFKFLNDIKAVYAQVVRNVESHFYCAEDQESLVKQLTDQTIDVIFFNQGYGLTPEKTLSIAQKTQEMPAAVVYCCTSDVAVETGLNSTRYRMMQKGIYDVIDLHDWHYMALITQRIYQQACQARELSSAIKAVDDSQEREKVLLESNISAVLHIQEGMIVEANEAALIVLGYQRREELEGVPVLDIVHEDFINPVKQLLKKATKEKSFGTRLEMDLYNRDGGIVLMDIKMMPSQYEGEPSLQWVISEMKPVVADNVVVMKSANHELLSSLGFLDKKYIKDDIQRVLTLNSQDSHSIIMLSIDNMPVLHQFGSDMDVQALRLLLAHFKSVFFHHDLKVYLLNDHQVVALIAQSASQSFVDLQHVLRVYRDKEQQLGGHLVKLMVNAVVHPLDVNSESSPETILLNTSDLLRQAKIEAPYGGNVEFKDTGAKSHIGLTEEAKLVFDALNDRQFELLYQHVYDTTDDEAQFFEVYTRLLLPNGELLTPTDFIQVAQDHALNYSDQWTLIQACKSLQEYWKEYPETRLVINLSELSLINNQLPLLMAKVLDVIGSRSASLLTLQFHEADVVKHYESAQVLMNDLKNQGVLLSISSFGSTEHAFELLDSLPITMVKLYRVLTHDLFADVKSEQLLLTLDKLNERHIKTSVSYIDSPSSMSRAWSMGARYMQGHFLAPLESHMRPREVF